MAVNADLEGVLEERAAAIDAALDRELSGGAPTYMHEACRHLVEAGGKRLRPVILLLAAQAVDPECGDRDLLPAAVAVEFVHTLSLIHDDIIDDDDLRRGVPAVHETWDRSTAIVAGDLLYARAFELVTRVEVAASARLEAAQLLADACRELSEGQSLDMTLYGRGEPPTEEEYLRIIEEKTGSLFAAAAEMGVRLAGGDDEQARAADAYGRALGVAFQLQDDVLSVTGSTEVLGKPVGSDLVDGKTTLVTIHAQQHGVDISPESVAARGLEDCRAELEEAGSLDYVDRQASRYVGRALSALEAFEPSSARANLAEIAKFAAERER